VTSDPSSLRAHFGIDFKGIGCASLRWSSDLLGGRLFSGIRWEYAKSSWSGNRPFYAARTADGNGTAIMSLSSHALQLDTRKRTMAGPKLHGHLQFAAWLAFDQDNRSRTGRAAWPSGTGFKARLAVGGTLAVVDFIRRCTGQGRVRTMFIVPNYKAGNLASKRGGGQWNDWQQSHAGRLEVRFNPSTTAMQPDLPMAPGR
jgi:hypothetical protein